MYNTAGRMSILFSFNAQEGLGHFGLSGLFRVLHNVAELEQSVFESLLCFGFTMYQFDLAG